MGTHQNLFQNLRCCLSSSSLLGSRTASITDRGTSAGPGRTDRTGWQSASDLTQSELRRTRADPVVPGRQSTLSRRADSERPGRHGRWRPPPAALDLWRGRTTKLMVDSIAFYSARVRRLGS